MADITFSQRVGEVASSTSLYDKHRIVTGKHTAFGISVVLNSKIIIAQSEGTSHGLIAGTKPVIYTSTNNGRSYTKTYLSLTGISAAASDDIRNIAGGVDNGGNLWVIATDYISLNENNCRLWWWRTSDGVTWTNPAQIIYNTTTYPSMTGFGKLIQVGSKLMFSAYGQKVGGVSVIVIFSSTNSGSTWTVTEIDTGNVSLDSNYLTETDIQYVSGTTIIAIARREDTTPVLYSSSDTGATWTNRGALTVAPSTKCHAPTLYSEDNEIFCLFSDRINGNIAQISVTQNYTTLAEWNASIVNIPVGSIVQTGFGSYNFGYTGVFGVGENRMIVMYDIALESPTPADIVTNALTHIVIYPLPLTPKVQFTAAITNAVVSGGSVDDDIVFEYTLRYVDNYGMLQSDGSSIKIPKDANYIITANMALTTSITAGTRLQYTMYRYNTSDVSNGTRVVMQGADKGLGIPFVNLSGRIFLRAGNYLFFREVLTDSGPKNIDIGDQPIISITEE